jgi:hypothetical protein
MMEVGEAIIVLVTLREEYPEDSPEDRALERALDCLSKSREIPHR